MSSLRDTFLPRCMAIAIGSLPQVEIESTLNLIGAGGPAPAESAFNQPVRATGGNGTGQCDSEK